MLIITGRTCSGKTSTGEELEKRGYRKLVTYTSRKPRKDEVEGRDYHFISLEKFLYLYNNNFFAEARFYQVGDDIWWYGSAVEDYERADDNTYVILNPDGVKKLLVLNLSNVKTVLIDASDDEIRRRQGLRGDIDDSHERRFNADLVDFNGMWNIVDHVVLNDCMDAKETANVVDSLYCNGGE